MRVSESIVCHCGGVMSVERTIPAAGYIRRRRRCASCGERLDTLERPVSATSIRQTACSSVFIAVTRVHPLSGILENAVIGD